MPGELLHKGSLGLTAEGYGPPWPEEHGSRGVREQKQMNAGAFLVPSSPWFIQPEPPAMRWCYPHSGRLFLLNSASAETPSETHLVVCLIGNQANNEDCGPLLIITLYSSLGSSNTRTFVYTHLQLTASGV